MTNTGFCKYKKVADKIIRLLCTENLSSIHDIEIIYNVIMGYPYCIDCEGHYIYNGIFYNSLNELPDEAKKEILLSIQHSISHLYEK